MVSLYFLPSTSMTLTLKSTPMVAEISSGARKTPSTKRMSKLLLPVPLLPMRSSLRVATVSEEEEAVVDMEVLCCVAGWQRKGYSRGAEEDGANRRRRRKRKKKDEWRKKNGERATSQKKEEKEEKKNDTRREE